MYLTTVHTISIAFDDIQIFCELRNIFQQLCCFPKEKEAKIRFDKKIFLPAKSIYWHNRYFFRIFTRRDFTKPRTRHRYLLYLYDPINRKVIKSWRLSVIVKNFAYPIENDNCSDNIFFRCQSMSRNDAGNRWKEDSSWAFLTVLETE